MPKKKQTKRTTKEPEGLYFLKLVLYLILGSLWVRINAEIGTIPIPAGLMFGLLLVRHERFQIDKKIEYALLLLTAFISFWLPFGLEIVL